jgi:hypothetical protein
LRCDAPSGGSHGVRRRTEETVGFVVGLRQHVFLVSLGFVLIVLGFGLGVMRIMRRLGS